MPRKEASENSPHSRNIEFRYAEPKSLVDLGIEVGVDKLNLGQDPFTFFSYVDPETGNQRFFATLHHPFAGEHLSQFLSNVAPNKFGGKEDARDDMLMPTQGAKNSGKGLEGEETHSERLHRIHKEDPQIGEPYQRLLDSLVLPHFLKAFYHESADSVFTTTQNMAFIRSRKDFFTRYFEECGGAFAEVDEEKLNAISYTALYRFSNIDEENSFMHFFKAQPEFDDKKRSVWAYEQFHKLPLSVRGGLLELFLQTLTEQDRMEFALSHMVGYSLNGILVDLETHQIVTGDLKEARIRFIDDETVEVSNINGTRITLKPNDNKGFGHVDWKAISYQFPPDYFINALSALIAWEKNESGDRRFLDQAEVNPILRKLFKYSRWADVKMGQALAAYFSPQVTKDWPPTMTLRGGKYPQEMGAAQMLLWPSIDTRKHPHASQLLNMAGSIIPSIEKYMGNEADKA